MGELLFVNSLITYISTFEHIRVKWESRIITERTSPRKTPGRL